MTVYSKPTVRSAWAETATVNDITDPGNTFASVGWVQGVKPPRQYMNWVLNYTFAAVRYFCQAGVPAWDATETYPLGAMAVSPNGYLMRSLQNNNINHIPEAGGVLGVWWSAPLVVTAAAANDLTIANTAWVHTNFLPVGAPFSSLSGSIANAQVPVGAVTQWQGSLQIATSQLLGTLSNIQVPFGVVQQWQGNLAIGWGQITGTKNADQLQGLTASSAALGTSIAARDINGYLYAQYLNQSSPNNENISISQVMVTDGVDGFLRKASLAWVKSQMGALTVADFPASLGSSGYQKLPSGFIQQWGAVTVSNGINDVIDVGIGFPITFPHLCTALIVSTQRTISGNGQAIHGSNFGTPTQTGGTITIDSSGGGSSTARWVAIGY